MKIIGISGLARSGKDLYCKIAIDILSKNGLKAKKYAFADELKRDVEPFLKNVCGIDVWTTDTEIKTDIRDFLVWYGTTFWRKRQPDRWIKHVDKKIDEDLGIDIGIVTDVRYPNEAYWIRFKEGYLVHISKYTKLSPDAGKTWVRKFQEPPNIEELKNDPIIQSLSDYKIQWEDMENSGLIKLSMDELVRNMYLREEVLKSLQAWIGLSKKLKI